MTTGLINKKIIDYYRRILNSKQNDPHYDNIRLKLFAKRLICALNTISRLSKKTNNPIKIGSFGSNLYVNSLTSTLDVYRDMPVHPLEHMLVGRDYLIGFGVWLDFIIGFIDAKKAARAGFWLGDNDRKFTHNLQTLYGINKFVLNKWFYTTYSHSLSPEWISFLEQEIKTQKEKQNVKT